MDREVEKEKRSKSSDRITGRVAAKSKYERLYLILVCIFLAAVFFYTLYIGQLLWGIVIDILILRLYFLMKQERRYFVECDLNEDEAGTPHDPRDEKEDQTGKPSNYSICAHACSLFVLHFAVYLGDCGWTDDPALHSHVAVFSEKPVRILRICTLKALRASPLSERWLL